MRRGLAMLAFGASTLAFAPVHRRPSMSTLGASMNVNDIVDKAYEGKSFAELAASPVSALQGMADWTDAVGEDLKIPTVGQLGRWKYFLWARALADLAEHEMPDRRVEKTPAAQPTRLSEPWLYEVKPDGQRGPPGNAAPLK